METASRKITRKQYDSLVKNFPVFMKEKWPTIRKEWSIGYVTVFTSAKMLWILNGLIENTDRTMFA